jgi:hypothetical protein
MMKAKHPHYANDWTLLVSAYRGDAAKRLGFVA